MLRLYVCVLEAKDLPVKDTYVKLRLAKFKAKTRILTNTCTPIWNQEFWFRVHEAEDVLVVSVVSHVNERRVTNGYVGLVGEVRIPVGSIAFEDNQTLLPTWFSLQSPNSGKFFNKYCGLFPSLHYLHTLALT